MSANDYRAWRERVERELGGAGFDQALVTHLPIGGGDTLAIEPLYTADHPPAKAPPSDRLAATAPGWQRCQLHAHPEPSALNRAVLEDLDGGIEALWLRLGGTSGIQRLADLDRALRGVQPEAIVLEMDAGPDALPAAALTLAWLAGHELPTRGLRLRFCADPLGALAATGELPGSIEQIEAEMATLAALCAERLPASKAITVSTLAYHGAGAAPGEELGLALATAVDYLRRMVEAGLALAAAAGQISLRVAVGPDLFAELAKLRALRRLWHRALSALGCANPGEPEIHAVTAPRSTSLEAPWLNVLRGTGELLAAVLAGADRVTCLPFGASPDSENGAGEPIPGAWRLARNAHAILDEECGLGEVRDPAGGSYYVERLTDELARAGWERMRAVEREGGMASALRRGSIHRRLGLDALPSSDFASPDLRASAPPAPRAGIEELVAAAASGSDLSELDRALRRDAPERLPALPQRRDPTPEVLS